MARECYACGVKKLVLLVLLAIASVAQGQPREREVLRERPSGFWTSNRPAQGGAYRWRLLALGVAIAGVTGIVMLRVLRNTKGPGGRTSR
jgi:hypothetical protein